MTVAKALITVFLTAAVLGVTGGLVGLALGEWTPDYVRQMFPRGDHPDFDPVQMGVGAGVNQGLIWGIVVGLVIVGLVSWHQSRLARLGGDQTKP